MRSHRLPDTQSTFHQTTTLYIVSTKKFVHEFTFKTQGWNSFISEVTSNGMRSTKLDVHLTLWTSQTHLISNAYSNK